MQSSTEMAPLDEVIAGPQPQTILSMRESEEVRVVDPDLCDTIADYAGQVPQIQALLTYAAKGLVGQYKAQFKIHFEKVG